MNDVATLFVQGIDVAVVAGLIEHSADLKDIAVNVQILRDEGIRVDLINKWLSNETNLNHAITIMNRGVDLNLIGSSSEIGGFTGVMGASPNEILSRIPIDAKIERWIPNPEGVQEGMKFEWRDASGKTWRLEMHGPDRNPRLPVWSNAKRGWVLRVKCRHEYMDIAGTFHKDTIEKPRSPNYNPTAINDTHIPIQAS